jgi:hypothetical protein
MQWFKDMFTMIKDLRAEAPRIGRWGFALNMPMWVGGLLFIQRPEGIAIFVLNTIAVLVAAQIHKRDRFSRLTSICHIAWLPVLPLLVSALLRSEEPAYFRGWLLYTVVTMAISLVLDARNLVLYCTSEGRAFERSSATRAGA